MDSLHVTPRCRSSRARRIASREDAASGLPHPSCPIYRPLVAILPTLVPELVSCAAIAKGREVAYRLHRNIAARHAYRLYSTLVTASRLIVTILGLFRCPGFRHSTGLFVALGFAMNILLSVSSISINGFD